MEGIDFTGIFEAIGAWDLPTVLIAAALFYWYTNNKNKKNGKSENVAKKDTGSLNGKARLEEISKDLRGLHLEVAGVREVVDQNALNLETYKREVDQKIAEKDAVDVEQREKIKALERTVYKDG